MSKTNSKSFDEWAAEFITAVRKLGYKSQINIEWFKINYNNGESPKEVANAFVNGK
jgi:hypothetical protein